MFSGVAIAMLALEADPAGAAARALTGGFFILIIFIFVAVFRGLRK